MFVLKAREGRFLLSQIAFLAELDLVVAWISFLDCCFSFLVWFEGTTQPLPSQFYTQAHWEQMLCHFPPKPACWGNSASALGVMVSDTLAQRSTHTHPAMQTHRPWPAPSGGSSSSERVIVGEAAVWRFDVSSPAPSVRCHMLRSSSPVTGGFH